MRVVAIVQARMGSARLPGKVLMDIAGKSMLAHVVDRLRDARTIDDIVIATTTSSADGEIVRAADELMVTSYRGSEHDVLDRYVRAARISHADAIVRVTADCPLLDAGVVDAVVDTLAPDVDYASNTHTRTFPRGLDVEALHRDTLERIGRMATSSAAREHVTAFVVEAPQLFRVRQVCANADDSDLRWTVDTDADLAFVRALHAHADLDRLDHAAVVALVRARPELVALNAHVQQKTWSPSHPDVR